MVSAVLNTQGFEFTVATLLRLCPTPSRQQQYYTGNRRRTRSSRVAPPLGGSALRPRQGCQRIQQGAHPGASVALLTTMKSSCCSFGRPSGTPVAQYSQIAQSKLQAGRPLHGGPVPSVPTLMQVGAGEVVYICVRADGEAHLPCAPHMDNLAHTIALWLTVCDARPRRSPQASTTVSAPLRRRRLHTQQSQPPPPVPPAPAHPTQSQGAGCCAWRATCPTLTVCVCPPPGHAAVHGFWIRMQHATCACVCMQHRPRPL
jgi:hypothetical protein